jgi:hypothetical protein
MPAIDSDTRDASDALPAQVTAGRGEAPKRRSQTKELGPPLDGRTGRGHHGSDSWLSRDLSKPLGFVSAIFVRPNGRKR